MKNGIKALVVAFFITTLISCAFPATAMENCYVGMSGGISKIDNRIESIERREFRYSGDILLKTSEKRIGSPHEIFAGCQYKLFGIDVGLEGGRIENFTTSVETSGVVYIRPLDETFSGSIVRRAEASGWSIGGLAFKRLTPRTQVYLRVGAIYATGILTIEAKQYPDIFIGTRRRAWVPRLGAGLEYELTPRAILGVEGNAFTKEDFAILARLRIKL